MGRLAVTLTCFFFFLFSFTTYAIALDIIYKTDVLIDETDARGTTGSERHLSGNFPDPETKTNGGILLPSEKRESKPATVVDWESDDTAAIESSSEQTTKPETVSVPLTVMSLRSVVHPLGIRPCRHHRQLLKPLGPGFRGREVSYGDDMLISGGFTGVGRLRGGVRHIKAIGPLRGGLRHNKAIGPLRGGLRHIKTRRVRFYPEGTRFPSLREPVKWDEPREDHKDETEPTEWKTLETEPTEILREEENHEDHHHYHHHKKGWFMGKVRKFFNQF